MSKIYAAFMAQLRRIGGERFSHFGVIAVQKGRIPGVSRPDKRIPRNTRGIPGGLMPERTVFYALFFRV